MKREDGYPFWGVLQSDPALTGPRTRKPPLNEKVANWCCSSITTAEMFRLNFSNTLYSPGEFVSFPTWQGRDGSHKACRTLARSPGMGAETSSQSTEKACQAQPTHLETVKSKEVHLHFRKEMSARNTVAGRKLNAQKGQVWPTEVTPSTEVMKTNGLRLLDVLRHREVKFLSVTEIPLGVRGRNVVFSQASLWGPPMSNPRSTSWSSPCGADVPSFIVDPGAVWPQNFLSSGARCEGRRWRLPGHSQHGLCLGAGEEERKPLHHHKGTRKSNAESLPLPSTVPPQARSHVCTHARTLWWAHTHPFTLGSQPNSNSTVMGFLSLRNQPLYPCRTMYFFQT